MNTAVKALLLALAGRAARSFTRILPFIGSLNKSIHLFRYQLFALHSLYICTCSLACAMIAIFYLHSPNFPSIMHRISCVSSKMCVSIHCQAWLMVCTYTDEHTPGMLQTGCQNSPWVYSTRKAVCTVNTCRGGHLNISPKASQKCMRIMHKSWNEKASFRSTAKPTMFPVQDAVIWL